MHRMVSKMTQNPALGVFSEALAAMLKEIVEEAVREAMSQNGHHDGDRFLDAEEAAQLLAVSPDWLYRHHKKLPFTRKLGPKMLRFSYQGIQNYLATRKIS